MKRRTISLLIALTGSLIFLSSNATCQKTDAADQVTEWPVLKSYDKDHTLRVALPLGGIGTGTVSLSGRGSLVDWEIMNTPSKGYCPGITRQKPFFVLWVKPQQGESHTRVLEGSIPGVLFEGSKGSPVANAGYPRFRNHSFSTAYPFGQVHLSDPEIPVEVTLKAFNPLIPGEADKSGIPVAVLQYELTNPGNTSVEISIVGNLPNFIGNDGTPNTAGCEGNVNVYREGDNVRGIFMQSEGVDKEAEEWGTMAITTLHENVNYRTNWVSARRWDMASLDFWDDFSADGKLEKREGDDNNQPVASLAVQETIPAHSTKNITFLITWHFPNRYSWANESVGNYYTTQYGDAWDVAESIAPVLRELEAGTMEFVNAFLASDFPEVVKEAALFNLSTLRTQTVFRIESGQMFGYEGCNDKGGCCFGSCTHVWNYEQATPFLFGDLARSMREVEFGHATNKNGLMSFRVRLPLENARNFSKAAADGQLGCLMKMYRDWQLSGDDSFMAELWPAVKHAMEFCWIKGGWDADKDGVMEGSQHNTMDVEYYGPNPQMQAWYLGALKAVEQMALYMGDKDFAKNCHKLFSQGSEWTDQNLFNGEYYEHHIRIPSDPDQIAPSLRIGMGASDLANPDFQLGAGCLVDQLVGQYFAHITGLGYLLDKENVQKTLHSIMKYNYRENLYEHFNFRRSYVLGDEPALLMASYPKERPQYPFPYFTEVMTGFEYTAAIGMIYEGQTENGLMCIQNIRDRYNGLKRNPFDEAECGHHYARAMASWAGVLALSGFHYSGVEKSMQFTAEPGKYFWSNGSAWGNCKIDKQDKHFNVKLSVLHGTLELNQFKLGESVAENFKKTAEINENAPLEFQLKL